MAVDTPELTVVMPVYNEEKLIEGVVSDWQCELRRFSIRYELVLYNDGSTDKTKAVLEQLAERSPELVVKTHSNRGHGPTILRGYSEAKGDWILQMDSDGEMDPAEFQQLWSAREKYDLILGCRQNRKESVLRRLISWTSRATVRVLFGQGIADVNTPFRLIRRTSLARILNRIPQDTFAPNVIMSGLAIRNNWRILQCWVPHKGRQGGGGSLVGMRVWKGALRSFFQTVKAALG